MWGMEVGVVSRQHSMPPCPLSPPHPDFPTFLAFKRHRFCAMTRKGNIQCQAFNYNCFGLLASTPNGHMESVLSHHKPKDPGCGVCTRHLVRVGLCSHREGLPFRRAADRAGRVQPGLRESLGCPPSRLQGRPVVREEGGFGEEGQALVG